MNWQSTLPLLILLSTSVTGILTFFVSEQNKKLRSALNIGGVLCCLILIGVLLNGVFHGESFKTRISLLPNIDLVFHADALSLLFISLSGLLWGLTSIYAVGYLADSKNQSRFFGFFGLCVFATMGIALAGNLITFLIFYELLTLTTFPLVAHKGNSDSIKAAKVYLMYTMGGGALFLAGVVWLKTLAGSLDFVATGVLADLTHLDPTLLQIIFVLIIAGLGVKAALLPLHGWLPVAMAAPAPVSALLHAVAVVKAGAFGIVRVVYDVYGVEFAASLGLTLGLAIAASITIVFGSVRALFQDDIKKRMAYSTVSQVSYIALGTAIAGPIATMGGIVHLVHQGIMKITLFFCAGSFAETLGVKKVSQMQGLGKRMPLTMTAFTIAGLGMIGVPPLAGFISKWHLGLGAVNADMHWVLLVLITSSLLNAAYFLPIFYAAWFKPAPDNWPADKKTTRLETHWMLLLPPLITATLVILAGLFAQSVYSPLSWAQLVSSREYTFIANTSLELAQGQGHLLWLALIIPLVFLVFNFTRVNRFVFHFLPLAALPAIMLALFCESGTSSSIGMVFLGSELSLTHTSRLFLLLSGILWFACALYSTGYIKTESAKRYCGFFLATMVGNFGLVMAQDITGFVAFFTLMSFASYGLITHDKTTAAFAAGKTYFIWVLIGEVCVFAGLTGFLINQSDSISSLPTWAGSMLIIGFGVKCGLFFMHTWLPLAHPVAPVPASALLSAIMVKAGLIGMLNFLPVGQISSLPLAYLLCGLGLMSVFLSAVFGVLQQNAKAVLAYSTISQMGLILTYLGTVFLVPFLTSTATSIPTDISTTLSATLLTTVSTSTAQAHWAMLLPAILAFAVHHSITKAALFLSVGIPIIRHNRIYYPALLLLCLPVLSMAGVVFSSGMFAKALLKTATYNVSWLSLPLSLSSIGTALLMLRFVQLKFRTDTDANASTDSNTAKNRFIAWRRFIPFALLCIASVLSVFVSSTYLNITLSDITINSLLTNIGVLALAIGLFVLIQKIGNKAVLPAGDIIVIYRALAKSLLAVIQQGCMCIGHVYGLFFTVLRQYFGQAYMVIHTWRLARVNTLFTPGLTFTALLVVFAVYLLINQPAS